MESNQALEVLENLANGVNPVTGEVFQYDSPYNHPTIIRALYCLLVLVRTPAKKKTPAQRQANNLQQGLPKNYGMPWTKEMLEELVEQFNNSVTPAQLATKYERSESSIIAQLIRLGAMSAENGRKYY